MDGGGSRAEAERWLYTANKLLSARDLHGARSFAIRARESDPTFDASELLLTVIDTVLAGETRINDHHRDWYGILQILRYTTNIDHIAAQYRRLALLLDPHRNPFAFSGHAFSLVHDAWSVLSNPVKKAMYDNDLRLLTSQPPPPQQQQQQPPQQQPQPPPPPQTQPQQPQQKKNPRSKHNSTEAARHESTQTFSVEESFWTSCPYCYVMYEYPKVYEECTLRCQSCRRGFHAVVIRSPPLDENVDSFCSWGFLPLGFSDNSKDVNGFGSNWNPFSPLFPFPLKGGAKKKRDWVYYDDEAAAAFINYSDPSEDDSDGDWRGGRRKTKRTRSSRRRLSDVSSRVPVERPRRGGGGGEGGGNENVGGGGGGGSGGAVDGVAVPDGANASSGAGTRAELGKRGPVVGTRRRAAGNLGKLDLNVEFSNDAEERHEPSRTGIREGHPTGHTEDNIEGIGFFEGLDEFLSSLPILNVVGDDKVKGH